MSETNPSQPLPRRRRRWLRFSLGTLFLGLTALCVALALWVHRAETQRQAVAVIKQAGGHVSYGQAFGPTWLSNLIGRDFFDRVTGVTLRGNAATDASVTAVGRLPPLESLRISTEPRFMRVQPHRPIEHSHANLSSAGLKFLARQNRLKYLDLSISSLTDDDLQWIGKMHGLSQLSIRSDNLSDNGVAHLKPLGQLMYLLLECSGSITDGCVDDLAKLSHLRRLDLSRTDITSEGVERLQAMLPKCRIQRFNPLPNEP